MSRYWKSIIAAAIAIAVTVVQAVQVAVADESWSLDDTLTVLLVFLGAAGVYAKANEPSGPRYSESGESTVGTIVGVTFLLLALAVVVALVLGRLLLLIL